MFVISLFVDKDEKSIELSTSNCPTVNVADDVEVKENLTCNIDKRMRLFIKSQAKKTLIDSVCEPIGGQLVKDYGSYEEAFKRLVALSENDENAKKLSQVAFICGQGLDVFLEQQVGAVELYSIGTSKYKNSKKCLSFLYKTKTDNMTFYALGSDECNISFDGNDKTFVPDTNPKGIKISTYLINEYQYSGKIPSHWIFYNKEYSF